MCKKCAIVTGANGAMGLSISKGLVDAGYHVVMACRNVEKGQISAESASIQDNVTILPLDLSSFHSINSFVDSLSASFNEIEVLVNNAGIISRNHSLTAEGYENTVAVNFVGTALLTEKIIHFMPQGAKIVNTVSLTTRFGHINRKLLYGNEKHFNRLKTYSDSKLALFLYTLKLAEQQKYFHIYAVDPGIVNTGMISMGNWLDPIANLIFRPFIKRPEKGAATALGLATGRLSGHSVLWRGEKPRKIPRTIAKDTYKQEELYDFIQNLA